MKMETFGKQVVLFVILLVTVQQSVLLASNLDCKKAVEIVNTAKQQPGNIDYGTFCKAKSPGASKLGCQIKDMDDVGLLVCLVSEFCEDKLKVELAALTEIKNNNLKVLDYCPEIINGLKCGAKGSKDVKCSGYLVRWIPVDEGMMVSIKSHIFKNTINRLVEDVRKFQTEEQARLKTGDDLEKIRTFMIPPDPSTDEYKRICDLQGFFMKTGGFVIADPEGVVPHTTLSYACYDSHAYPTNQKVINGLEDMKTGITK